MRFKDFLAETRDTEEIEIDEIKALIKRDCQHFLSIAGDRPLYRGIKDNVGVAIDTAQPEDRSAVDSTKVFNFMFNAGFKLAFDIQDIRRKCFFAASEKDSAEIYGKLFFVFPKGKFDHAASLDVDDSWSSSTLFFRTWARNVYPQLGAFTGSSLDTREIFKEIQIASKNTDLTDSDTRKKIAEALNLFRFYFENLSGENKTKPISEEDVDAFIDALRDTFKSLYKINPGLTESTYGEIMFFNGDGYYAIRTSEIYNTHYSYSEWIEDLK